MTSSVARAPRAAISTHVPRTGAGIWIAYAVLGILVAGYLAIELLHADTNFIDNWGVDAFELTASGLCLARGFTGRSGRTVALVLGAALLSWAVGDIVLTFESLG